MTALARKLGLFEAIGLSLSILAPTMAMAFNVSLAAQTAGRATPLAFAIGTAVLVIVGLSFVTFSRRIAHAGSAYAYISLAFGRRWGFVAGWALLLSYLSYAAGVSALAGNFINAAAQNCGVHLSALWIVVSVGAIVLAGYCAFQDMKLAARLMLWLEGLSVLAIVLLSVIILAKVAGTTGFSVQPFTPSADFNGWSGIGYGLVFAILSFAGLKGRQPSARRPRTPTAVYPSRSWERSSSRASFTSSSPTHR